MQWRTRVWRALYKSVFPAVVLSVLVFGLASAQDPAPTLEPGAVPDAPLLEPSMQATADALEAAWVLERESRSITDFRIAYLIAPGAVTADSLMSEQSFSAVLGAEVIHDWDTFSQTAIDDPYQMVLIHDSAYDMIDTAWTQHAYRNGIIIAGIGMPFEHLVEITGDRCVKPTNPSYADQYADWVIMFSYVIVGVDVSKLDESVRSAIDFHWLTDCSDELSIAQSFGVLHGVANFPLTYPEMVPHLAEKLLTRSMDYGLEETDRRRDDE